jgi:hypothetical protein
MARGDGVDRISVRNVNLSNAKISNTQRHNEREKESYTNPDIVPERSEYNIHFKAAADDYERVFARDGSGWNDLHPRPQGWGKPIRRTDL